jgi:hypothetical protein
VKFKGETSLPDPVDGSSQLKDSTKGSRSFEPKALDALGATGTF